MKMSAFQSLLPARVAVAATLTVACLAGAAAPARAQGAAALTGIWIDHTGRGAVEITQCGASLCGHIAWLKEGTPTQDGNGRPLCGLQIIGETKRQSDGSWDNGWIYDPERDDKFSVELRLKGQDALQVLGYMGMKMLGETYVWKRAPASLAKCVATAGSPKKR